MSHHVPFPRMLATLTLSALFALAGCEDGVGPDDRDLTSDDADAMAAFILNVDELAVAGAALASSTGTRSFTRKVPCPAGGSVSASGSSETSTHQETRVVSAKWSTTQTHTACAIGKARGDNTWTAVMDGTVTTSGAFSYQLPETRDGQRTLLSWASATVGSITTKVGDRSRTCATDIQQTWDPVQQVFTVKGTVCGRQVDTTRGLGK